MGEKQRRPKGTVVSINEPNYDLMARAIIELYRKYKDQITVG